VFDIDKQDGYLLYLKYSFGFERN